MNAARFDITIDRAAEYDFVLTIQNQLQQIVDLSEDTAFYSDIRETISKKEVISFNPILINGGEDGQVSFNLQEEDTLLLSSNKEYEYDIFMQRNGVTSSLLYGTVSVRANITKGEPIDPII